MPRPAGVQRGPGRHLATAITVWSTEMNIAVMECYILSNPVDDLVNHGKPFGGYRRRMHSIWKERQSFNINERRLLDQARLIRKISGSQHYSSLRLRTEYGI